MEAVLLLSILVLQNILLQQKLFFTKKRQTVSHFSVEFLTNVDNFKETPAPATFMTTTVTATTTTTPSNLQPVPSKAAKADTVAKSFLLFKEQKIPKVHFQEGTK